MSNSNTFIPESPLYFDTDAAIVKADAAISKAEQVLKRCEAKDVAKKLFPSKKRVRSKTLKREQRVRESQRKKRRKKAARVLSEEVANTELIQSMTGCAPSPTILSQLSRGDFDLKCNESLDSTVVINENQENTIPTFDRQSIYNRFQASLSEVLKLQEDGQLTYPLEPPKFTMSVGEKKVSTRLFPKMLRDTMKTLHSFFKLLDSEKFYNDLDIDLDMWTLLLESLYNKDVKSDFLDYKCVVADIYRVR